MKKVYVAGAYSADNVLDVLKNIGKGQKYCADLFALGFAPFCPWHDKDYAMLKWEMTFSVKQFYDASCAWLKVSDCMLVIPGWEKSKGCRAEVRLAKQLGIPVYYSVMVLEQFELASSPKKIKPYEEAFKLLCGGRVPPFTDNPRLLDDDDHFELQTWCLENSPLPWTTGLGVIEAAHNLVFGAVENDNFSGMDVDFNSLLEPEDTKDGSSA